MSNYNIQLQSNNTDLQTVLQTLQTKAAGGEQTTPVISVSSNGLITATAGTKSSTHQLAFQAAKTITPSTASQIAVSSGYYTGGNITVAGDANLVAGNIKSGVSIFGVNGTLVEGDGDTSLEDAFVTGAISEYTNSRVSSIGAYAFYCCYSLTSISFPNCTTIGSYAFNNCSKLTTVSFPNCTSISSYAFNNCSKLTSVSFPNCTSIGSNAFRYCSSLTSVSFPNCTTIGTEAFASCSSLTSVNFPNCTTIGTEAFYCCYSLTSVSFPKCTTIGSSAFRYCSKLTSVSFPNCTSIGSNAFANCSSLTSVSFPNCMTIGGSYAFTRCYNLSQFYLTGSSVCKLSNSNAFSSTPYTGYSASFSGTPYIYVPQSLLTSYRTATNWTYFSSYFSAVEGSGNGGGDSGGSSNSNIITFAIGVLDYQAEEGMTWDEWCDSKYNTNGFYIDGNIVRYNDSISMKYIENVNSTDTIINGKTYSGLLVGM